MKKLLAILLAVAMICALSASAWAAPQKLSAKTEEETIDWNWEEYKEFASDDDGDFYTFDEVAVIIWIPKDLESVELTDEDVEDGYIGYFAASDDDEDYVVSVTRNDVGIKSLDEWIKILEEEDDVTSVSKCTVNGLDGVFYLCEEDDYFCVDFLTESDKLLEFGFYPFSDEDFTAAANVIIASIQPEE